MKKVMLPFIFVVSFAFLAPEIAEAKQYLFRIKSTSIAPRKANKKRWDFGFGKTRLPDVQIIITIGKTVIKSTVQKNTLKPNWKWGKILNLRGDEWVTIKVLDVDIKKHDLIGERKVLFARLLKKKPLSFNQVLELKISVTAVTPNPVKRAVKAVKKAAKKAAKKADKKGDDKADKKDKPKPRPAKR